MIFHSVVLVVLSLIGLAGLWQASMAVSGPLFLVYLLVAILAIALIPGLIYRMYALQRARYILARDGISLYWGLRREEIPINQVLWLGHEGQYRKPHSRPFLRFPGAMLGVQTTGNAKAVEYLAARSNDLAIIETPSRAFAISPANTTEFLQTYRKLAEFGSLTPIQSISDYPTSILSRSWADRPARILLILSALLVLGLIMWVSLSIPSHPEIALRLNSDGTAVELIPGVRLLLLPVLNTFFFITNLLLGFFFYRREDTRSLSYLMWASSAFTSILFMGAVYFILQAT